MSGSQTYFVRTVHQKAQSKYTGTIREKWQPIPIFQWLTPGPTRGFTIHIKDNAAERPDDDEANMKRIRHGAPNFWLLYKVSDSRGTSLQKSPSHHLDMTDILLNKRITLWHQYHCTITSSLQGHTMIIFTFLVYLQKGPLVTIM